MTEQEQKAIKWMQNVRDDAVVTLDHIAKEEPDVSPMLYAGRKEKAETIINGFEELQQYREIGTVEECREAVEKQTAKKPKEMFLMIGTDKGGICPCCNKPINNVRNCHYCNCGQRLEW
ncbi:hypothetical protein I6E50_01925 [Roseburia hominis]|uniref:hypothetical protein n=1 Tax=Roseburia hominis TaxID=301301 RepID=UPI001F403FC0|nr:hypothetical protein [Roseburia hominis]